MRKPTLVIVAVVALSATRGAGAQTTAGINMGAPVYDGRTFFEAYDEIVDTIVSSGAEVYGLLNDELASSGAAGSQTPEDSHAANALAVVDRYKDRVRVWEIGMRQRARRAR